MSEEIKQCDNDRMKDEHKSINPVPGTEDRRAFVIVLSLFGLRCSHDFYCFVIKGNFSFDLLS